jgi:hypothetical protein
MTAIMIDTVRLSSVIVGVSPYAQEIRSTIMDLEAETDCTSYRNQAPKLLDVRGADTLAWRVTPVSLPLPGRTLDAAISLWEHPGASGYTPHGYGSFGSVGRTSAL